MYLTALKQPHLMSGSCCVITRQTASHSESKNMNQRRPWKQETDLRSFSATRRSPGQPKPREILSQNKTIAIRGPCSDTIFFKKSPFLVEDMPPGLSNAFCRHLGTNTSPRRLKGSLGSAPPPEPVSRAKAFFALIPVFHVPPD